MPAMNASRCALGPAFESRQGTNPRSVVHEVAARLAMGILLMRKGSAIERDDVLAGSMTLCWD